MTEKFFYESKEIKVHLEAARGQFKAGSTIVDSGGWEMRDEDGNVMSKSRVYQFYKNMGMRKNKNEKTEFAKRMELFGGDESPKDPKEQQAQEFRKFMRQNCPALQKAEKIRRNQVSYFERRMAYNQKYHKMSLIDKYLEARKRSSKYKRRLEGSIFRCRRVQNDAKNTFNTNISPRLFDSIKSAALMGRNSGTPEPHHQRVHSQQSHYRPLSPPADLRLASPKSMPLDHSWKWTTMPLTPPPRMAEESVIVKRGLGVTSPWKIHLLRRDNAFTVKLE